MSIEESINALAQAIGRMADAINDTNKRIAGQESTPAETKPKVTKPKAEPAAQEPAAPAQAEVVAAAVAQADAALASSRAAEVPTYDSTRALMLQVVEKFGRDEAVTILGACGLQDLKKGTAEHFAKVTTAALAKLDS
jgi:hypothetical protein